MTKAKTLLIVDDDPDLREVLADQLQLQQEFEVIQAGSAAEGMEALKRDHVDLVLLDVGLPDGDGRQICQQMRAGGLKSPIIMLTGSDTEADTIQGLEAGASDYVTKPFRLGVLIARIRAQLRQHEQSDDAIFAIGPYRFRPASKVLLDPDKNRRIRLTEKETAILKYLFRAGDKPIARDVLLNEVWGYNSGVTTHTLETHVYRLRQKIERNPAKAEILVTEQGGYRLVI
ncbi:MAG: response regulator transcription factor [Alphaproteobacteria bacterium]|nr:response regulator transcription factor [Alphaproteobacteria bacterium]